MGTENIPIACDMHAFNETQRERYQGLRRRLLTSVSEIREEKDGYSFRFHHNPSTLVEVAEWIALEQLCCPFLHFTLELLPAGSAIWLKLGEGPAIKEFLKHEFGRASQQDVVFISLPIDHNET